VTNDRNLFGRKFAHNVIPSVKYVVCSVFVASNLYLYLIQLLHLTKLILTVLLAIVVEVTFGLRITTANPSFFALCTKGIIEPFSIDSDKQTLTDQTPALQQV
jgi:hypothetical protein